MAKEYIEREALLARYDAEHVGPPGSRISDNVWYCKCRNVYFLPQLRGENG